MRDIMGYGENWDESSDFYGDGIPEMLQAEGYWKFDFVFDQKFMETLAWIAEFPEVDINGNR